MADKLLLLRSRSRALLAKAIEAGFTDFLLEERNPDLGRVNAYILRKNGEIVLDGKPVGRFIRIRSGDDERAVRTLRGKVDLVVVETSDWKVIPLENLIAALGGKTRLLAVAHDVDEARLFLQTLETGVDGVVLQPRSAKDLVAYRALVAPAPAALRLVPATITRIEALGMGERVCVDTGNLFEAGEGLLVGSASHGFFLVAAECYESQYVAARPFRVNAGAVHAYLWGGDKTRYLSEVRAGATLEAVDAHGNRRAVVVGRAKIETRPLVLIEAECEGRRATVLLQNAETIRLTQPGGRTKSVSRLRVGDRVLFHPENGARHFGMKVEERVREL